MTNHRHKHKYTFGNFIHDISPATKEVGHIFDKGISTVDHIGTAIVNQFGNVSKAFINKSGSLLGQISTPLIIVGGVIAFMIITKK